MARTKKTKVTEDNSFEPIEPKTRKPRMNFTQKQVAQLTSRFNELGLQGMQEEEVLAIIADEFEAFGGDVNFVRQRLRLLGLVESIGGRYRVRGAELDQVRTLAAHVYFELDLDGEPNLGRHRALNNAVRKELFLRLHPVTEDETLIEQE